MDSEGSSTTSASAAGGSNGAGASPQAPTTTSIAGEAVSPLAFPEKGSENEADDLMKIISNNVSRLESPEGDFADTLSSLGIILKKVVIPKPFIIVPSLYQKGQAKIERLRQTAADSDRMVQQLYVDIENQIDEACSAGDICYEGEGDGADVQHDAGGWYAEEDAYQSSEGVADGWSTAAVAPILDSSKDMTREPVRDGLRSDEGALEAAILQLKAELDQLKLSASKPETAIDRKAAALAAIQEQDARQQDLERITAQEARIAELHQVLIELHESIGMLQALIDRNEPTPGVSRDVQAHINADRSRNLEVKKGEYAARNQELQALMDQQRDRGRVKIINSDRKAGPAISSSLHVSDLGFGTLRATTQLNDDSATTTTESSRSAQQLPVRSEAPSPEELSTLTYSYEAKSSTECDRVSRLGVSSWASLDADMLKLLKAVTHGGSVDITAASTKMFTTAITADGNQGTGQNVSIDILTASGTIDNAVKNGKVLQKFRPLLRVLNGQLSSECADGSESQKLGTTFAEQLKLPAANSVQAAVRSLTSLPPYVGAPNPYSPEEATKHIELAGGAMWNTVTVWDDTESHGTVEIPAQDNKILLEREIVQRRAYNSLAKVIGEFIKFLHQLKDIAPGTVDLVKAISEDLSTEIVTSTRKELHPSNFMYTALTHLVEQTHPDAYKFTVFFERIKFAFDEVNQHSQAFLRLTAPLRIYLGNQSPQEFNRVVNKSVEAAVRTTFPFDVAKLIALRESDDHFFLTSKLIMAFIVWQLNTSITTDGNTHWRTHLSEADVKRAYAGSLPKEDFSRILHNTTLQGGKPRNRDKPSTQATAQAAAQANAQADARAPQDAAFNVVVQSQTEAKDKPKINWTEITNQYRAMANDVHQKLDNNVFAVAQRLNESCGRKLFTTNTKNRVKVPLEFKATTDFSDRFSFSLSLGGVPATPKQLAMWLLLVDTVGGQKQLSHVGSAYGKTKAVPNWSTSRAEIAIFDPDENPPGPPPRGGGGGGGGGSGGKGKGKRDKKGKGGKGGDTHAHFAETYDDEGDSGESYFNH